MRAVCVGSVSTVGTMGTPNNSREGATGAVFATIPAPVVGGAGLILFGMIFASGAAIFHRGVTLTRRNLVILAVALALGLGVELRPDAIQAMPAALHTLIGSGLIMGGLTALVLNAVLPEREAA